MGKHASGATAHFQRRALEVADKLAAPVVHAGAVIALGD
jgi:hypothetical protein